MCRRRRRGRRRRTDGGTRVGAVVAAATAAGSNTLSRQRPGVIRRTRHGNPSAADQQQVLASVTGRGKKLIKAEHMDGQWRFLRLLLLGSM